MNIQNKQLQFTTMKNNVWFTSDTHFLHYNIIKYCSRPFKDEEHMTEEIIKNWNRVVKENDIVFHLGDFMFGDMNRFYSIRSRLNGKIYLVIGNHDWKGVTQGYYTDEFFEGVYQQLKIVVDGQNIYLNHFPFLTFDGIYKGKPTWQLFGHVHSNDNLYKQNSPDKERLPYLLPYQYDVGMDNNYYTPISFSDVKSIIEAQILKYKEIHTQE